ncbi:phosphotransferase family protein [Halomarina salina]|uniref:Phosphotransferase family protein n=1 Tax=Halomarina salina TaxID=1872699 RepID=A0ABD5RL67_9EURY|nr:phosphotransferase [Halomarina salina]
MDADDADHSDGQGGRNGRADRFDVDGQADVADPIATALDAAFPHRAVTDLTGTGPSWNELNETVGVAFADDERAYCKIATDGDGTRIRRERAVVDYVGANGDVPVPTVLASDPDARVPYLATAPVDGPNLLDEWDGADVTGRAALARRVGASLARLHRLRFDVPGHVVGGDADALDLDTASWTDVLLDWVEWYRGYSPSDRFDHHFDAVLDAVESNRGLLDDAPAALLHCDTAKPNCFVGDDAVGFLDWEIALVGDPVWDLHRGRCYLDGVRVTGPEAIVDGFFEGYRETADGLPAGYDERVPVYRPVWLLSWSGFFDNYLQFVEESPEELAEWVEREMDRRLGAIA